MSRYVIKVKDDHSDYEIIKHIFSNENQKKLFGYKCFKCNWCKVGVEFLFLDVIVPDYNNDKFAQILESANCELAIYEYTNDAHIRYMTYCRYRYYKRYLMDFYISDFVEAICQHRLDYTSLCRRLQHEGDAIGVDLSTSKDVLHEEVLVIATAANYLKGYLQRTQTVDAVSVIHCKDCRHYQESLSTCDYVAHYNLSFDDFCSKGEVTQIDCK